MWPFRRRDPEPEPVKRTGGPVWTLDDVLGTKQPPAEHIVTDLGGGKFFHTWKAAPQTEAQRQAAEDAAIREFDRQFAPDKRQPVAQRRPSVFDRPPDPDSFPS